MRGFPAFIGVDLGGGKSRRTAVALLRPVEDLDDAARVEVVEYHTGREGPLYDEALLRYLRAHADALIAIDAPLSLPSVLRCTSDGCGAAGAAVAEWFAARHAPEGGKKKPRYTPYTQRAVEIVLADEHQLALRETLGQGMGPLTARGVYLRRALSPTFRLDDNLIEVDPKATLRQLVGDKLARRYKRSATAADARGQILEQLPELRFAAGAWRQDGFDNDHKFDAVLCAFTAYLYARGACIPPPSPLVAEDGWIWVPQRR